MREDTQEADMRSLAGAVILCFSLAGAAHAQSDPFTGTWKADESKSTRPPEQAVTQELVILNVANNVEHCINDNTFPDGKRTRSEYKATYNDGKWYPTMNLDTGQPGGSSVMMVRYEPRKELRLTRRADGSVGSFIWRMVQEDGKTMKIITFNPETGKVGLDLVLYKQ
jgi:hypothetical protein